MSRALLLHNPRCSKSRAAVAFLQDRGVDFDVREYLKEPLSFDELRVLKARLGLEPKKWLRWNQPEAKAMALRRDDPPLTLLRAMAEAPILMQRPILIAGDRAAVGRPGPEALLGALD